jgi:hypothetical protein
MPESSTLHGNRRQNVKPHGFIPFIVIIIIGKARSARVFLNFTIRFPLLLISQQFCLQ